MRRTGKGVDLGAHDLVDDLVQQLPQDVGLNVLELLANERDRLHRVAGHRVVLLSGSLIGSAEDGTVVLYAPGLSSAPSHTTSLDVNGVRRVGVALRLRDEAGVIGRPRPIQRRPALAQLPG